MQPTCPRCRRVRNSSATVCDYCRKMESVCMRYEWTLVCVLLFIAAVAIYLTLPRSP